MSNIPYGSRMLVAVAFAVAVGNGRPWTLHQVGQRLADNGNSRRSCSADIVWCAEGFVWCTECLLARRALLPVHILLWTGRTQDQKVNDKIYCLRSHFATLNNKGYNYCKTLLTVDSLSTISPLITTSSTCLSLSDIFAMSNRQASAAICSTGCSTAVIVG